MMTTTIKLSGGILGSETMMVRCQLANAAAPVEVDYCVGEGWQGTQYQAGDARHTTSGLAKIGIELAQSAVQEQGTCDWEEVANTYTIETNHVCRDASEDEIAELEISDFEGAMDLPDSVEFATGTDQEGNQVKVYRKVTAV